MKQRDAECDHDKKAVGSVCYDTRIKRSDLGLA